MTKQSLANQILYLRGVDNILISNIIFGENQEITGDVLSEPIFRPIRENLIDYKFTVNITSRFVKLSNEGELKSIGKIPSTDNVISSRQTTRGDFKFFYEFFQKSGFGSEVFCILKTSSGKIFIGGSFVSCFGFTKNRIVRLNDDFTFDFNFNSGSGFVGSVNTIVETSDNKFILGGSFVVYIAEGFANFNVYRIIKLNNDGSRDVNFNEGLGGAGTGFDDLVRIIKIQPDGKILVGGDFSSYNDVTGLGIVRLNADGTRDLSFDANLTAGAIVSTIEIQPDGKILIGGVLVADGNVIKNIFRLNPDGSRDMSFDAAFSDEVKIIKLQPDGKILVGGIFEIYRFPTSETQNVGRIVRLDNDILDESFNTGTGFNNEVFSIELSDDGKILVGGKFTQYDGTGRNRLVRLNNSGSLDTSLNIGTGFNNVVNTILYDNGEIFVGGNFTTYKGI